MTPPEGGGSGDHDPHEALRRIEERVRRVQDLGPFEIDRREDGRFRFELETPLSELDAEELRRGLDVLESLTEALREQLEAVSRT